MAEIQIVEPIEEQNQGDDTNNEANILVQEAEESELLGKEVSTEKLAYELYNDYAYTIGFGIRMSRLRKRESGVTKGREFCCNKEGKKELKGQLDKQYTKLDRRTGCKAMVYFEIDKNNQFVVVRHRMEHNHKFCPPGLSHHIRSQRSISKPEIEYLSHLKSKGVGVADGYRCLKAQVGSSPALGFSLQDAYQAVEKEHKKTFDGTDIKTLINYFKRRQEEEEDFYYDFEIDVDTSLVSFIWGDKKMKIDYLSFGDLLVFDTTYRTNKYDLICAPFVGMNNHTHNCMFGCGFILNERISSFEWLFTTFLKSMGGLYPCTIMTYQAFSMAAAISTIFPNTKHRLCVWHIGENSKKHIRDLRQLPNFEESFSYVTKKCHTEIELEHHWNKVLKDFKCENNVWLTRLYSIKEKWCRCYGKDHFSGGVLSSQRSESTNHALTRRLTKSTCLCDFYNSFCEVISEWRSKEGKDNERSWKGYPETVLNNVSILHYASREYTINAYKIFEKEFMKGMSLSHELKEKEGTMLLYLVWSKKYDIFGQYVTFDEVNNQACCTCKRFEEKGMLCRHIHRIYHIYSVEVVPHAYMLKRWSRSAKATVSVENVEKEKSSVGGAVWRMHMQRKFHKLLCASDDNRECRKICEDSFNKTRSDIEKEIGNLCISEDVGEATPNKELIANPKGKREKYTRNDRKKSILEIKTNIAKRRKQGVQSANVEEKKTEEDVTDEEVDRSILPYYPMLI